MQYLAWISSVYRLVLLKHACNKTRKSTHFLYFYASCHLSFHNSSFLSPWFPYPPLLLSPSLLFFLSLPLSLLVCLSLYLLFYLCLFSLFCSSLTFFMFLSFFSLTISLLVYLSNLSFGFSLTLFFFLSLFDIILSLSLIQSFYPPLSASSVIFLSNSLILLQSILQKHLFLWLFHVSSD